MMKPHTRQIENLSSLYSTLKRPRAIEVKGKLSHLIVQGLRRRIRIHTAPRHIPCWLLKFQIKLPRILRICVCGSRVVTNVQAMNIGRWKQQEVLLAGDNGVEILVVILVEGGSGVMVTDPEVHSFGLGANGLGGPGEVGVAVGGKRGIFGAKAIVLLLRVSHQVGGVGGGDEAKGLGEGHVFHVRGGEAEGGVERGEGVGGAGGGEVEGDGGGGESLGEVGGVGPGRECGPVCDGVGDYAWLVWGDEVS